TITTVGYGDRFPTTIVGRWAAVFLMVMGIGIIGSLASIMASVLVSPTPADDEEENAEEQEPPPLAIEHKLDLLNAELVEARTDIAMLRELLEREARAGPIAR